MFEAIKKAAKGASGIAQATMIYNEPEDIARANERITICLTAGDNYSRCEHIQFGTNPITQRRATYTCGSCGCDLQLKGRVPNEKCPIGKW